MTEPVNLWQPTTDKYKAQAAEASTAEAELKQRLEELHASNLRKPWKQDTAPLGIRLFTWYYLGRAALCALLLLVIFTFPKSAPSTMLSGNIGSFLHLPGSKSEQEARQKEIEAEAQAYAVPEDEIAAMEGPGVSPDTLRSEVMAYLLLNLAAATIVGFMWWNRSWKIRWITMFYSGALVAKALINVIAGAASGVGSSIDPSKVPILMVTLAFNGFIFLYLAFGYDVKKWFEEEA